MPYIKLNDKGQIVGESTLNQAGFEFVEKIPTDIVNVSEKLKELQKLLSELGSNDYKIIRYSEKKSSSKSTKLTKEEFTLLSNERDVIRNKIDKLRVLIGE